MTAARGPAVLMASASLALIAFMASLAFGSVSLAPDQLLKVLSGDGDALAQRIVLELRLPRALSAVAVGGLLALAGCLMQVLLRNPLADPYILGVSGGAAVGALSAILLGAGLMMIDVAAAVGATLSTLLVFSLAHGRGDWSSTRLLLTGVVVAAGWGALTSLLLVFSEDGSMRSMLFWLMGDLTWARRPGTPLLLLVAALAVCIPLARHLDLTGSFATEPFECAWATEAIFFIRVQEMDDADAALDAAVQISADGIHWVDEGTAFDTITDEGVYFARVSHFGGWLRLRGAVAGDAARFNVMIHLVLKE